MPKYQVNKYFSWGSLKLEPLQYLLIEKANHPNSYLVVVEKNDDSIMVTPKALAMQVEVGNIRRC